MGNFGFTGKEITKKLDHKTVSKGGLEIINMPRAKCKVASELEEIVVEVGGWKSIVNYNKDRENQHEIEKWNKAMRKLRRNIRNKKNKMRGEGI